MDYAIHQMIMNLMSMKTKKKYAGDKLGIFAGGGDLPRLIFKTLKEQKKDYIILALEGLTPKDIVKNHPHVWLKPGAVSALFKTMKAEKISSVIFAGAMLRPNLKSVRPDLRGLKIIAKFATRKSQGDDALLRLLQEEIESEGFPVIGIQTILKDVLVGPGLLTKTKPNKQSLADIEIGKNVLNHLSDLDIGQSVIVQDGRVLGLEAAEGTDALIQRSASLHRKGQGGVLVKLKKKGQSDRFDLPTIGPQTIELAAKNGLSGIAVSAHSTIILNSEKTIKLANTKGLFLQVVKA